MMTKELSTFFVDFYLLSLVLFRVTAGWVGEELMKSC